MQIARPGEVELVERSVPVPGPGEVLIAVEACGVCGADVADVDSAPPPRVPGHEVVGRIVALGAGVPALWQAGQRVGVGRLGGHCNVCPQCRQGRFQLCTDQPFVGSTCDGGYAEMMVARCNALVAIPDELDAHEAAPILCAGLATFNALRKCGAQAGDTVAIAGIGGLGHMAVQYARRMGFRVIAVGRGTAPADDALALGAHRYVDTHSEDAAAVLQSLGGAQAIVSTMGTAAALAPLLAGLAPTGRLVLLGAGKEPLPVAPGQLVVGERQVIGSITGSPYDNERTLDFSVLAGVRPMIETMPLERASEALARIRAGTPRYRIVLTMTHAVQPR
ncbi:alcohol dehydrogenase catalytic domain-containing protein [Pseudoduganella flava]|nr:alcohol dehydrogenase catalytic domain-containing protein [Pseudoduganella flava]